MKVGLWAEIRRLAEMEKLSARVISRRLHCSWRTVAQALELEQPPARSHPSRGSRLQPVARSRRGWDSERAFARGQFCWGAEPVASHRRR